MSEYYEMPHERADECPHAGVGKACAPCRWRFALLSDETVERAADILEALDGDDYLTVARAALTVAIGDE